LEKVGLEMTQLSNYMLDKTVTQKRKGSNTGASVEAWADVVVGIKMAIYPAGSFSVANYQSPYNNIRLSHNGYCFVSAATFKVGDRVTEGSNIYTVLGFNVWDSIYELKLGVI
jgi:hypothetical protein